MISAWALLPLFFLLWGFFVSTSTFCLNHLGEYRTNEVANLAPGRSIYLPLNQFLFPLQSGAVLVFAHKISCILTHLGFAASALVTLYFWPLTSIIALVLAGLIYIFISLFIFAFFPYLIALKNAEKGLRFSLGVSSFFLYLSLPFALFFLKLQETIANKYEEREGGDPLETIKETILEILQKANVQGKLGSIDKKLIESVVKFKDRIVREVLVPRVDLFCLPVSTTIREASKQLIEEGYSRVPVYRESVDNVVGVLMFKDILELYMDVDCGKKEAALLDDRIEPLIKRPFYTPETKKVSQLLQEFRSRQMHMAIVVDEYGGTEGVVTIEDILEEIVGEIADEYDFDEEELYTQEKSGVSWIVDARMNLLDAEETFGIHIPQEGDYDTIGGYLFHRFGVIPKPGQKVHHEEFDMEILSSSERSVEKVRIIPHTSQET